MGFSSFGKILIISGGLLILAGAIVMLTGKIPGVGRFPGDILIKRGSFTFYFPLATCLIISAVVSLVFFLISRR
ncbi:MAG: DUF2905 domain-containing protein [Candidatus Omnitrophica bacterium]|nr:DUF2905 domain-containing protein [Candidatus Omnitrophota bacterium]